MLRAWAQLRMHIWEGVRVRVRVGTIFLSVDPGIELGLRVRVRVRKL